MKNIFIGGMVVVVLIAGGFIYITQYADMPAPEADTSTNTEGETTDTTRNPSAPSVTTKTNVAPTDETAVVVGTVTPNGDFTSYWYEYGTTADLGSNTSKQNIGSGYTAIPATGYITGLSKKTTYHFRLTAKNQYGTVSGSSYTFQTTEGTPAPVGGIPTAKSIAANALSRDAATLRGEVTPNKATTHYWFEYGTTANVGSVTALTGVGTGSVKVPVSVSLADLDPATTYYFRLNAQNQFGTVNGSLLNFKTDGPAAATAPAVSTRPAIEVGTSTARLRGVVDPNGAETKYWFEYGTDSLFSPASITATVRASAGASSNQEPAEAVLSSLTPKTTYYFRVVAQNSVNTVRGPAVSFKTK